MITKKNTTFKFIILLALTTLIGLIIKKNLSFKEYQNKVFPNIYINNIYIGGKDQSTVNLIIDEVNQRLFEKKLLVIYNTQPIATFSGSQLNLHYDKEKLLKKSYLIGREKNFFQRLISLTNIFLFNKKVTIDEKIKYDRSILIDYVQYLKSLYNKPAKNALFKFENNRVISFRKEENGLEIDSSNFFNDFEKIIQNDSKIQQITIKEKIILPEITLAKANDFGIEEKIGSGSSNFSGSISERIFNITLAASKFNGILIPPQKILSFNETLGEVSSVLGYKKAYVIKEGKTILDDGGGVCQVSTTLFRAVLNSGLPIIERTAHTYRVSYYENDSQPGFDATVYTPYIDFKFKNDTPSYILIETEIDKEKKLLFLNLYGKKDGRKIIISPITIWDISPPPEAKYQEDATLKKGVIKQVEWPAWGAKTSFNYQVIKEGKIIFKKTFFSYYRPWPAIYLVGAME